LQCIVIFNLNNISKEEGIMSHQHLKVKTTSGLPEIIKHLECLIQSLKQGSISISTNRDAILLRPREPVTLEFEAEVKLEKYALREKMVLEMKWKKNEEPVRENVIFMIDRLRPQEAQDKAEPACEQVMFMIDHLRPQEAAGKIEAAEITEAAPDIATEERLSPCAAVPDTTAILDPFDSPAQEDTGKKRRKASGTQISRAVVRKPGRR
jgi:amphi-Trp domain-containing protein